ncbi:hypothetical protein [Streptacidiphilus sp. MAP5-52]|uniref:hypothetical protein n=1 Tax=Streptacidiphilus sp. MAP5-52 TaxID=3156267 RepID=UPI0035147BFD
MASALLRRPGLFTALEGHQRLAACTEFTAHGLDWVIERTVARGTPVHDPRMLQLLQDRVAGLGLHLLDHTCGSDRCTVRCVTRSQHSGGLLTITSGEGDDGDRRPGRPLTLLGEGQRASRPGPVPARRTAPPEGRCFVLTSVRTDLDYVGPEDVRSTAVRLVAAWAAQGHNSAVLTLGERDMDWTRSVPRWPTEPTPWPEGGTVHWSRLRIVNGPGEAWIAAAKSDFGDKVNVGEVLREAKQRCSRILVVDDRSRLDFPDPAGTDGLILMFSAAHYPKQAKTAKWRWPVEGERTLDLDPLDSAAKWREEYLGKRDLTRARVAGLLLMHDPDDEPPARDAFTEQVEGHLARYGTPVLGWLHSAPIQERALSRGTYHTVLDPMPDADRLRMLVAAERIGAVMQ